MERERFELTKAAKVNAWGNSPSRLAAASERERQRHRDEIRDLDDELRRLAMSEYEDRS